MEIVSRRTTADGEDFRFRAGRASLDLCSTVLWRHGSPVEQLERPGDLSRWLVQAGLCAPPAAVTDDELAGARSLREAIYRLLGVHLGDGSLSAADVARVNDAAAHPGRAPQFTPGQQVRWITGEPVAAALSEVARDMIDLLAGPLAGRIRECAAADCALLFVDTSRPGTRRWCAMNRCGNREHVREHRSRARADPE